MVAASPVSFDRLYQLFSDDGEQAPTRERLRSILKELENDYYHSGIELVHVSSGYRFQARKEVAGWISRLWDEKRPRYSRALLETLAIIAYRQPITRGEIEKIRGVAVSTNIVRTLIEREWVRVVGHRDVPGKPAIYATTKQFLDYFNLQSLSELPSLAELTDIDGLNTDLFADSHDDGDLLTKVTATAEAERVRSENAQVSHDVRTVTDPSDDLSSDRSTFPVLGDG